MVVFQVHAHTHNILSVVTFLWLHLTAHCSCLTTAKKLAVFGMIHHLSIDWLLRWWIHGVCAECWNPVECVESDVLTLTHTETHTYSLTMSWEAGLNRRAEPGSFLYWLDVLGLSERSPRCWWFNLSLCTQMSPSSANTSRHTHIHTRHLPRSHLHTITQQPLQSHTYSSALSKLLLSYLIIHMLNSHTDFGVVN